MPLCPPLSAVINSLPLMDTTPPSQDNNPMSKRVEAYYDSLKINKGKTILITGGNSGVGFAVAKLVARSSWNIIFAVRSQSRGQEAVRQLKFLYPEVNVRLLPLDLSSKESIEAFIAQIKEEHIDIDVFYCNAGIYRMPYSSPYDGLESHMAVNCVSNYYLYEGLKDYLHALPHPVKWILTSSIMARPVKIVPQDLFGEKRYVKTRAYNKSKLAVNYLYTYLVNEEKGTNLIPLLVHPGVTYTPLINKAYQGKLFRIAAMRFMRLFSHKPEKAALSTCYLLQEDVDTPRFCGPRGPFHISGYPKVYPLYQRNIKDVDGFMEVMKSAMKRE